MRKALSVVLAVMLLVQAMVIGAVAEAAEPLSLLPTDMNLFSTAEGNGYRLEITQADTGYRFATEGGWPSAYFAAVDASYEPWIYVNQNEETYLNFDFEVETGATNVLVYFCGQNPADEAAPGSFVSVNGLIDPSNANPVTGDTTKDLGVGHYQGSVKVSDLGCHKDLIVNDEFIISGFKVFAVGGSTVLNDLSVGVAKYEVIDVKDPVVVTASTVDAEVGDTITVDVSISENHYLVDGQLNIYYDANALEIQKPFEQAYEDGEYDSPYIDTVATADILGSGMYEFGAATPGTVKFVFARSADVGNTTGGTLFSITFKVLDGAAGGTDITLEAPNMSGSSSKEGGDYMVYPVLVNGRVNVPSAEVPTVTPGDVNGDGDITLADAMQAFYHVNEKITLEGDGFAAADLDGNGEISLGEAMKIFYFVNEKIDSLV